MKTIIVGLLLALSAPAQQITWTSNSTKFVAQDIDTSFLGGLSVAKSAISVCTPDATGSVKTLALTVYYNDGDNVGYGTYMMPPMGNRDGQSCFSSMFRFTVAQIISVMVAPAPVVMTAKDGANQ